jgi:hypothetical protein
MKTMLRIGGLSLALTLSLLTSGGATPYGTCTTICGRHEVIQWPAASYSACCDQETTYCSDGLPRTGNSYIPPGGVAVKCGS